jgi:hypothetical protein
MTATTISWQLKHAVACRVAKLFTAALHNRLSAAAVKTTLWLKHTASHGVVALQISASE